MTSNENIMAEDIWYNKQYRYEFIRKWINLYHADSHEEKLDKVLIALVEDWLNKRLNQLDKFFQASPMDYHVFMKQQEILNGKYGNEVKECFIKMSMRTSYTAAWYMLLMEKQGESITLYGNAMIALLEDGVLYTNEHKPNELVLYLGKAQNNIDKSLINFVNYVFLPFGYTVKVFWDNSFGIIDQECCGGLSEIMLY